MKRLRGGAGKPGSPAGSVSGPGTTDGGDGTGRRPARVRNRLVGAVAVVAVAILGAGAPAIATAADNAQNTQQLVDLAELNARAIALAHSLADERDAMTAYVAAGRSARDGDKAAQSQRARVDRQIGELRAEAGDASGESAVYAEAAKLLAALPQTRHQALSGPGSAEDTFDAYTQVVQALGAISDDIARGLPARADAADADTRALPALGRAADQAAGTRGLLLAALNAGGPQPRLAAAAQLAHLREQGALGDFTQSASQGARDRYDRTVNGTDVTIAERYLTHLTDQPFLDAADLRLNRQRVQATLTARVGLMRGVESAMATADIERLAALRDDDVTQLEIRIGLEGLCLLLAVGAGVWAARSLTQPLAALRIGAKRVAEDPAHEEPIAYKGRNDEFAAAVRSVNALHAQVGELARRTAELEGERKRLVGGRQRLVAEREVLQEQGEELREEVADLTERLAALRAGVHGRFVNLSLRTLGLVERQLGVIEALEEQEHDPERLETLFKLDHFAARMRRNSENLLVLAGAEHATSHVGPVPLLDVLRASISEIERYERVRVQSLPPHSQVAGFAADDLSHLVAELLENATAFSPPDAHVEVSGWLLESGEVMLSVQDEGIGMTPDRLAELNERLSDAEAASSSETVDEALGLGLYVVVRLAARHGIRVQLRDQKQGGVTAVVVLPRSILPTRPAPAAHPAASPADAVPGQNLPGSVAEANSNALLTRRSWVDRAAAAGAVAGVGVPAGDRAAEATEAVETTEAVEAVDAVGAGEGGDAGGGADSAGAAAGASGAFGAAGADAADAGVVDEAAGGESAGDALVAGDAPGADDASVTDEARGGDEAPESAPLDAATAEPVDEAPPAPAPAPAIDPFVAAAERAIDAAGLGAAPEPSPYGPESPGPYAVGGGEHTRPEDEEAVGDHGSSGQGAGDPYAIGPDEHARPEIAGPENDGAPADRQTADRTADQTDDAQADDAQAVETAEAGETGEAQPADAPSAGERRTTGTGLPKRTPKIVAQQPPAPRTSGGVNAEALRRRLGGFQQGARDGRREVEAEIAERTAEQHIPQADTDGAGAPGDRHVVEEARD
ncbi:sensor histidine kinase [Streptomyces piniterrae]|uniref:histidine kinase n=1 Tax=Streptomyces piniterrae TaxID=2571125 RepID=A0A4U0N8B9_9ACTN|nr:nitrate- and nitrite sensing domain-containing protein [Streptomyces piniterrae]TJZ45984.1 sensor histidine kinase [Streptomyces piniterrae]